MSRETYKLGLLAASEGEMYGRPYKSADQIHAIAEKLLAELRTEQLPLCQVKDVAEHICFLADFEPLK